MRPRKYEVDLTKPPEVRWNEIIDREESNGKALVKEVNWVLGIPGVDKFIRSFLSGLQRHYGGDTDFHADMKAFADGWGISIRDIVTANLSYELAHFRGNILLAVLAMGQKVVNWMGGLKRFFGCTAVCRWFPRRGWIHGRNMDWFVTSLGPYSIIVEFKGEAGRFTALSWPGFVGVLQGVAKGRFSATINYAPPDGLGVAWPPLVLLREVFNRCGTFDNSVALIQDEDIEVAAASFFMLCGVRRDEAVVIEKGRNYCVKRRPARDWLVQTNHHQVKENLSRNNIFGPDDDTFERRSYAARALPQIKLSDIRDMYKVLDKEPVWTDITVQQMVMAPKTGKYDFLGVDLE
jgi:hypothetical protein